MSEQEIPETTLGEAAAGSGPEIPGQEAGPVTLSAAEGEVKPQRKARQEKAEAAGEEPRPKRGRAAREPKPQAPLLPLALWRQGRFETVGEARMVKGPYDLLVRPDEPKEGDARRPITNKLEIEGQFCLPPELVNTRTALRLGSLLLQVYVLSTSHTGGASGDTASFIIVREISDEEQGQVPQAA